jgi:ubiquinone/menaquinone biosynthesis C-methylase UbiE
VGLTRSTSTASDFYDRWTRLFVDGFGPVLQAGLIQTGNPPKEDPEETVLELARRAGLRDGDRVFDAGCGVGGPAVIIAKHYPNAVIHGVTVSAHQARIARERIAELGFSRRVHVFVSDYQQVPLRSNSYDRVIFFESTGYAADLAAAFQEAHRLLRVGGKLYVKDVFRAGWDLSESESVQMERFDEVWGCVSTKTIPESARTMKMVGFQVDRVRQMDEIGTTRFTGSMFSLDGSAGLRPSELGASFARRSLNPPILFGEIIAVKDHTRP